ARQYSIRASYISMTSSSGTVFATAPLAKLEGYGKYAWTKGSSERLKNIPKLPDELFEMIKVPPQPTPTPTTTTRAPRVAPVTPTTGPSTATTKELKISRHSVVACPSPSWTTTQLGSE
ncbi:MAG: hypothetical protein ACKPKO_05730, partial [Candidatus Fonsibacter sp.]